MTSTTQHTEPSSGVIRHALIAHIREQIAAGTYVTQGKLKAVAGRLSRELAGPGLDDELD